MMNADDVCDVLEILSPVDGAQAPALVCHPERMYTVLTATLPRYGQQVLPCGPGQELLLCGPQGRHVVGVLQKPHVEAKLLAGAYVLLSSCKLLPCEDVN
jgi:hypothetical protein